MDNLEDRDPNLSEEIRSQMFRFEDLTEMDGNSLQTLFKSASRDTWLLALRAADDYILKNFKPNFV